MRFNIFKDIVSDARKKRSIHENDDKNQFEYTHKKLLEEISQVFSQKSKFWITNIKTTKGKTTFLIKKSSKLTLNYKPRKKYQIDSKKFEDKEERKEKNEEDSMNKVQKVYLVKQLLLLDCNAIFIILHILMTENMLKIVPEAEIEVTQKQ